MLVAVIQVKDYSSAKQQINLAIAGRAECIELRLDYLTELNLEAITHLLHQCPLRVIFTLRKPSQGGFYEKEEPQRLQDLLNLCKLNPDYLDLEYDIADFFLQSIRLHYPDIKLICSYHNFKETPADLLALFEILKNPCFYAYKIVTHATSTVDALRMVNFVYSLESRYLLTGICMGEDGQCTRILSPVIGNAMNYVCLNKAYCTIAGQLTLNEYFNLYHLNKLNRTSKIYALLGDPVSLSVGHILHNQAIEFLNENAVYIKLRVTKNNLSQLISLTKGLPFGGLSITMPLKESILSLLDEIEYSSQPIQAINSVRYDQGKLIGFNSDGIGAIQALSTRVNITNQKMVILGAGGAARAIAYEALQHKAKVVVLSRTLNKAKKLADGLGCKSGALENLHKFKKRRYTILINTLPHSAYSKTMKKKWLKPKHLIPNILAMDIIYQPPYTQFLSLTQSAQCTCILGYETYIYQALIQIKHWFNPSEAQLNEIKNRMITYFLTKLKAHPDLKQKSSV